MNKSVMKCCICNNENIGQFITINNKKYHLCCIEQLQQENKKLNGTIQTYDILLKANVEENKQIKEEKQEWINLLVMFKNQQKEFIEYLEDYLKLFDNKDIYEEGSYDTIEEILSKYKEIIGVSDEKK